MRRQRDSKAECGLVGVSLGSILVVALSLAVTCATYADPPERAGVDLGDLIERADQRGGLEFEVVTEDDGIRDGPGYRGSTIYVPSGLDGPAPAVVVVPGYRSREVSIKAWGPFLASHGLVTMTIGTNRLAAFPFERGTALLDAIETLRIENGRPGSPLEGRIDLSRIAVAGWSMGGGGAQHAAARDSRIAAVVAFCPWHDGSKIDHTAPLLVIAGETDFLARPERHARRHFRSVADPTPRLYYEVRRAGHWVGNAPDHSRGEVGRAVLAWLKLHLEGDQRFDEVLDVEPPSAVRYERKPSADGERNVEDRAPVEPAESR